MPGSYREFCRQGKRGGKVHQSLLVEQITQCDSERLLSAAKRGCTTLPHRKKLAMRRQCCLTAQAAGRQGPAGAAGWGPPTLGDRGAQGGQREGTGGSWGWTCSSLGHAALLGSGLTPKTPCPWWGGFCCPWWALPTAPSSLGRAPVGVACHGRLSKGLSLVARWKKTKF